MTKEELRKLKAEVLLRKGQYGLQRFERALDEIPNLHEMFSYDALKSAFVGDNAKALMTMNPASFQDYAVNLPQWHLDLPDTKKHLKNLAEVKGFSDVPYLDIDKKEQGSPKTPHIAGHEGRHRSIALTNKGVEKSLVQLFPRAELREPLPRRDQSEYIGALRDELAMTGNMVTPEKGWDSKKLQDVSRPSIKLPDVYGDGGSVHGHVVDSEGNPLTAYHGTSDEIDKFQLGHPNRKDAGWLGHGIYSCNSPAIALTNAKMKAKRVGGTPKVMSLHVNLQNPYYATLEDKGRLQRLNDPKASQAFTQALKDKGHDGVIWKQNDYHEYVAFHPDQIKILPQDDVVRKDEGGEVEDYQGAHTPPGPHFGAPLHDLTQLLPDDIYGPNAVRYYGTGDIAKDRESFAKVHRLRNKPNQGVQIYRAVPKDPNIKQINPKDWVTINKDYAIDHGKSVLLGKYKILSKIVSAKHLYNAGDSIHEWGYHPNPVEKASGGIVHKDKGGDVEGKTPISDWNWRPMSDVQEQLGGLEEIPSHVLNFGKFMDETANKAGAKGLSARDLIKAFTITRASIQRGAVDADKVRAAGLDLDPSISGKVRPEGAFGEWLHTDMGQRYLKNAERGSVDPVSISNAVQVMAPFGRHTTDIPDALTWAAKNIPGKEKGVSLLVVAAQQGTSDPSQWRDFIKDIRGIGPSKAGFVASLLGRGDQPTLDARQLILHTGQPSKAAAPYLKRKGGADEAVERLAERQRQMNLSIPSNLSPYYQHLAHHTVWDAVGGDQTTHQDVINAMQNAAQGGRIESNSVIEHPFVNVMQAMGLPVFGKKPKPIVKNTGGQVEADSIPAAPGTTPIKEGHVRLYHQTDGDSLREIEKHGLLLKHAKGIEGPRAIYAGETPFYGDALHRPTLEFQVPKDQWQPPFVLRDVKPEDFIAAHYPWHRHARYLEKNNMVANVLSGKFDNVGEDEDKAVNYLKRKYAVKKATGGPVSLDAMRLALLNVPKMADGGDFESDSLLPQGRAQRRMASNMMAGPKPLTIMKETGGQWLNGPFGNVEPTIGQYRQSGDATPEKQAVNNWVNTTLTKYMKRDFGTENDPVRLLHEQGITHYSNPDELESRGLRDHLNWITKIRKNRGMPEAAISKSNLAKGWEAVSDPLIRSKTARGLINNHSNAVEMLSENPWMKKVDPQTKVFSFETGFTDNTGFKHLTDELHSSLLENTNLPKSLQLRPESLNRMSVAQAVSHVHKINNWRKENMGDASLKKAMSSAVHLHKDYPDSNYAWYEIKHPEMTADEKAELRDSRLESMEDASESLQAKYKTLEDALQYEGDVMGHCVGGYADEVASGKSRIFSLRNKKTGEPHVTVETYPKPISTLEALPSSEKIPMQNAIRQWRQRNPQVESLTDNHVREALKEAKIDLPEDIKQIKGKGNDKPVGKYITFVQDFVKSGNWSNVSDLKNTDLRDLEKTPNLRQWLKGKNIPHSRFVSEDEYNNHEGDFLLDRLNEKAQGGIVRKADGGTIKGNTMPTLAQMRMALMKPNDISSIGASEAPSMSPKAYISPDKGELTLNGIPIGGVDMSGLQQGQQLMPPMPQPPQQPPQPQGGPQPPQGALPEPSPQGPPQGPQGPQSNMLEMTPQGQMMGAMKPQGAASGGSIQYPTINPAVLRNQDDDANLQKVNWMSGGDVEGMSKGGSKHPIIFPPAPEIKKQRIIELAERMFRQSAGLENPNNKTLKQLRREQDLPVDVRTLGQQKEFPTIDYEKQKGSYLIGVPGDPSIGGVIGAGSDMESAKPAVTIAGIGDKTFESAVPQWGGKDYGTYGHPQGWAGNISGVRPLSNAAKAISEIDPDAKILGQYVKMSPESLDFALHHLDTLLAYQQPEKFPKKYKDRLTKLIRGKYAPHKEFPSFAGFDKPEDVMLQAQVNSDLRKKLVHVLSVKGHLPPDTPSAEDVIFAVSHPELRDIETGASGSTILQIDPTVNPEDLDSPHPTYSKDLPSKVIGRSRHMKPVELAFPRSMEYARQHIETLPEHKRKSTKPFSTAKMIGLREPFDDQYINQIGEYETQMKKLRGYKKGGKVSMDAMQLALINRKKGK